MANQRKQKFENSAIQHICCCLFRQRDKNMVEYPKKQKNMYTPED